VFYGHVLSLKLYKQQYFSFYCKTVFEINKLANRQVRRRLIEDEMNRGIGMLEAGRSQRHVAHVLGVSQSVVSRMWNQFQMTGNVLQGHVEGRERLTT
jgi:transposase